MQMRFMAFVITFSNLICAMSAQAQSSAQCACQPPSVWSGTACNTPQNNLNACDDGSGGGTASIVSSAVTGITPADKFKNVVNKKLACCLNSIDPTNVGNLKYDCADNSNVNYATFDALWKGSDTTDAGGQPYAMMLTTGGNGTTPGKPISGFYNLAGGRCDQFSEFAGTLRSAKVNPGMLAGQQNQVAASIGSPACAIEPGAWQIDQPNSTLTGLVVGTGKTVPYDGITSTDCKQAMNMRTCPILVRAAMIATCPRNPMLPGAQVSYTDTTSTPPVTHCLAAATVRIFVRIEQIYEVSGMPNMPVVDTVLQQGSTTQSISNIIQTKVGNACPAGTSLVNGSCMGCTAGCGNTSCTECSASTVSIAGAIQCTACGVGTYSLAGSSACQACTNNPLGKYWVGNGTAAGNCSVANCTNGHNTWGGLNPNCP